MKHDCWDLEEDTKALKFLQVLFPPFCIIIPFMFPVDDKLLFHLCSLIPYPSGPSPFSPTPSRSESSIKNNDNNYSKR